MSAPVPLNTVLGVHLHANEQGLGFYSATVVRLPQQKLHNTRLWLPRDLVRIARQRRASPERVVAREAIVLNVTNTLHWNPLPQGTALRWRQLRLTLLDPPPRG